MKKFIIAVTIIVALILLYDACYYRLGIYVDLKPDKKVTTFVKTEGDQIFLN